MTEGGEAGDGERGSGSGQNKQNSGGTGWGYRAAEVSSGATQV